jgi:hypothetical protein
MMGSIASTSVFGGRMELAPDKYKWIDHNDQQIYECEKQTQFHFVSPHSDN